jgi:XTP/dITP diphosphohydrolase
MNKLWLATSNKGKVEEMKLILQSLPLEIHYLSELNTYASPPENGKTFLENARIKCKSLKALKKSDWVLAEDSGLVVDGLGGMPGIFSARYAGDKASDRENVAKVLKMLQIRSPTNRKAEFVCQVVVMGDNNQEWLFEGRWPGLIAKAAVGSYGFGYDPIFVAEGQTQTLAELGPGFKNQHSHRRKALDEFIKKWNSQL